MKYASGRRGASDAGGAIGEKPFRKKAPDRKSAWAGFTLNSVSRTVFRKGAFQGSCLWLSSLPSFLGFIPGRFAIVTVAVESQCRFWARAQSFSFFITAHLSNAGAHIHRWQRDWYGKSSQAEGYSSSAKSSSVSLVIRLIRSRSN